MYINLLVLVISQEMSDLQGGEVKVEVKQFLRKQL